MSLLHKTDMEIFMEELLKTQPSFLGAVTRTKVRIQERNMMLELEHQEALDSTMDPWGQD